MFKKIITTVKKQSRKLMTRLVPEHRSEFFFTVLLVLVFVVGIGFLPLMGVSAFLIKQLLLVVITSILLIAVGVVSLKRGYFVLPGKKTSLIILGFLGVMLLSSIFAKGSVSALFGSFNAHASFLLLVALFIIFYTASIAITKFSKIFGLLTTIAAIFVLASIHQLLRFIFGPNFLSFGFLDSVAGSVIGSWTDFSVLSLLMFVLAVICLEVGKFTRSARIITMIIGVLGILGLFMTNIHRIWLVAGALFIILSVYLFSFAFWNAEKSSYEKEQKVPWYSIIGFVIILIGILFGGPINSFLSKIRSLTYVEITPTFSATATAGWVGLREDPLFGVGMNNFEYLWNKTKPVALSGTPAGALEFSNGYSFITTQLATTGVLGIIAWVLLIGLFIHRIYYISNQKRFHDPVERFTTLVVLSGSVLLSCIVLIHNPGTLILVLWAIFVGMLWGISRKNEMQVSFIHDPRISFFGIIVVLIILLVGGAFIFITVRKTASLASYSSSLRSFEAGNRSAGVQRLVRANQYWPTDFYNRMLINEVLAEVQNLNPASSVNQDALNREVQRILSIGLSYAEAGTRLNPLNYRNWIALGNIYRFFTELKIEGSGNRANESYTKAKDLSPHDRTLDMLLADVALSQGNVEQANQIVQASLQAYPTADAYIWLYKNNVAAKNYSAAEQNLLNAFGRDQRNESILSELGTLYFVQGKYTEAITAFERSLTINRLQPAIFAYLGVSYESTGKLTEATQIYEFLKRELPDTADRYIDRAKNQKGSAVYTPAITEPKPTEESKLPTN